MRGLDHLLQRPAGSGRRIEQIGDGAVMEDDARLPGRLLSSALGEVATGSPQGLSVDVGDGCRARSGPGRVVHDQGEDSPELHDPPGFPKQPLVVVEVLDDENREGAVV